MWIDFCSGIMQIVTLFGTKSAAASDKSVVPCRDGSRIASYARDLLSVEREKLLDDNLLINKIIAFYL